MVTDCGDRQVASGVDGWSLAMIAQRGLQTMGHSVNVVRYCTGSVVLGGSRRRASYRGALGKCSEKTLVGQKKKNGVRLFF